MKKYITLAVLWFSFISLTAQKADLIIFSYDRPLQLYALLESTQRYIKNIGDVCVIYRSSDDRYDSAYNEIFQQFSTIHSFRQGVNPKDDFKPLTLKSFLSTPQEYVLFAVDDIIVQDSIDLAECIVALKKSNAYGFYLRLGNNITYSYMADKAQRVPALQEVFSGIYSWIFSSAQHDWAYPNTVDMTVFRKKDIEEDLRSMQYQTPNSFEYSWYKLSKRIMSKRGLCYAHSKIVNIPLNMVQTTYTWSRHENSISTIELLELFERGLKIDINPLHTINNTSPHMAYAPTFIPRISA